MSISSPYAHADMLRDRIIELHLAIRKVKPEEKDKLWLLNQQLNSLLKEHAQILKQHY